jgi:hypothetical protein
MSATTTTPSDRAALDLDQPVAPLIAAARAQFLADFPDLLAHRDAHPDEKWVAYHGSASIPTRRDAIILWVSVTAIDQLTLPPDSPRFPAVLDTGFNDSFLMQSAQLTAWGPSEITTAIYRNGSALAVGGETIDLWDVAVWLHPNLPGSRSPGDSGGAYPLELPNWIALTPTSSRVSPVLPLLGMLAIRFCNLRVEIDGEREAVNLFVPDRRQP